MGQHIRSCVRQWAAAGGRGQGWSSCRSRGARAKARARAQAHKRARAPESTHLLSTSKGLRSEEAPSARRSPRSSAPSD